MLVLSKYLTKINNNFSFIDNMSYNDVVKKYDEYKIYLKRNNLNNNIITMRKKDDGSRLDLHQLLQYVKKFNLSDLNLLEIGVYSGESTEIFLNSQMFKNIYSLDIWKNFYDACDLASYTDMEVIKRIFMARFKNCNNVHGIQGNIDFFIKQYKNIKIDMVYIDANHSYDGCKHDIETVIKYIKPKILAGHDWGWNGVKNAVLDTIGQPDKLFNQSWFKYLENN